MRRIVARSDSITYCSNSGILDLVLYRIVLYKIVSRVLQVVDMVTL